MKGPPEDVSKDESYEISRTSMNTAMFQQHRRVHADDKYASPEFYALLLASCKTNQNTAQSQILQLDLSTISPLLKRAIEMAIMNKMGGH